MSRLLKSKRISFTQTPNDIIQNKKLSFKARGLWGYLESKPQDWRFSLEPIADDSTDGIDSVRTGVNELEKLGYLERKKAFKEDGTFDGYDYIIHIEPFMENPMTENPSMENPMTENPSMENPMTYKERDTNKDLEIKNNKFFSLRKGVKIFQKNDEKIYPYQDGLYVIFNDNSEVFSGSVILPILFIDDYFNEFHPQRFFGLLKYFEGSGIEKMTAYLSVKQRLFHEKCSCKFEDFDHYANTIKKISRTKIYQDKPTQTKDIPVYQKGQENRF